MDFLINHLCLQLIIKYINHRIIEYQITIAGGNWSNLFKLLGLPNIISNQVPNKGN